MRGAIGKYDWATLVTNTDLAFHKPDGEYWFGCDNLGRDYWCQVWYSMQTSVKLAALVGGGECLLGIVIGCLWGYVRWLDRPITELYNIINNVPMIIYLTLIALIFRGLSFPVMCITLIAFGWLVMARNVRKLADGLEDLPAEGELDLHVLCGQDRLSVFCHVRPSLHVVARIGRIGEGAGRQRLHHRRHHHL